MATKPNAKGGDVTGNSVATDNATNGDENNAAGNATGNASGDGNGRIDPTAAFGDDISRDENGNIRYNKDGSPRKKRGRKPGSAGTSGANSGGGKSSSTKNSQNLTAIETLAFAINGFHIALAAFTKAEELQLEDSESEALAKSVWNVAQQFDMSPDPRIIAIGGLIATAAQIYGPRIYVIADRRKKEKPIDIKAESVTESGIDLSAYNFSGNA